jgi:hypothetical protein
MPTGSNTGEGRNLRPRERHPQIQTSIAPSDAPVRCHLLPALHLGREATLGTTGVGTYKEAHAVSLKRLSDLITESCQENSLAAKIRRNLALPAPRPKEEARPVAKPGHLMLDAAIERYCRM